MESRGLKDANLERVLKWFNNKSNIQASFLVPVLATRLLAAHMCKETGHRAVFHL